MTISEQLTLFTLPPPTRHLFILEPKNQHVATIIKNCGLHWELVKKRVSWDGVAEYLLRSGGLTRLTYWVRLEDDNNFWIVDHFKWQDPASPERKQAHVDWLAATGQYVRPNK